MKKRKELEASLLEAAKKSSNKRKIGKCLRILAERNKKFLAEPEIDYEGLRTRFDV